MTVIREVGSLMVETMLVTTFEHFCFELETKLSILVSSVVRSQIVLTPELLATPGPRADGRVRLLHVSL